MWTKMYFTNLDYKQGTKIIYLAQDHTKVCMSLNHFTHCLKTS